jgi:hypothetical protein
LKIIASDSCAANLDEKIQPKEIFAHSEYKLEPPCTQAEKELSLPIFTDADCHNLILKEIELSRELMRRNHADIIHLDMTLGGICLTDLTFYRLSEMRISREAKENIRKQLPQLRKIAEEIRNTYSVNVLAIGKESIPVRIAELTTAAYALIYSSKKVIEEEETITLGLPTACTVEKTRRGVIATSLIPTEDGLIGYGEDEEEVLNKVRLKEMMNPILREFRMIQIRSR